MMKLIFFKAEKVIFYCYDKIFYEEIFSIKILRGDFRIMFLKQKFVWPFKANGHFLNEKFKFTKSSSF